MGIARSRPGVEVGLVVANVESQTNFYGTQLGLAGLGEIGVPGGRLVRFDVGGGSVLKLLALDDPPAGPVPAPGGLGLQYITFYVNDLDSTVAQLQRSDTVVEIAVTEVRPGLRFAFVHDPEGNRVELVELSAAG